MLKYIETKSELETNNEAPNVVNKIIKEYSDTLGLIKLLTRAASSLPWLEGREEVFSPANAGEAKAGREL